MSQDNKSINISSLKKGLNTDSSFLEQDPNTYRYALNAINESEEGDANTINNEESNEICGQLSEGYIPIGNVYIGDNTTVIFSCNEDLNLSEIGTIDNDCNYIPYVNWDLNFKTTHKIDAVYRLRRGCEKIIYFTDNLNKPRIFNFNKIQNFKNNVGQNQPDFLDYNKYWQTSKFNLFKNYSKIPNIKLPSISDDNTTSVIEGGVLEAGSYNIAVQYLDEDLNPTEWVATTDTIIIYHDSHTNKEFSNVRGTTNKKTSYQKYEPTNKAIKVVLETASIDRDTFLYYRLALIAATNGTGEVTKVVYSQELSTKENSFIFTGNNHTYQGSIEEIRTFNNIIDKAKNIEQIENRLILSNVQGKPVNWCKLQKYASKIKSNVVFEKIVLNNLKINNNPKRPTANLEKVGYMPGEIYAFGIVYIFEDGTVSPVYHIPGTPNNETDPLILMNKEDNTLSSTTYIENTTCNDIDFWGQDYKGNVLSGQPVRHHRFPTRNDVNKPLFQKQGDNTQINQNAILVSIIGTPDTTNDITISYTYTEDGKIVESTYTVNGQAYILDSNYNNGSTVLENYTNITLVVSLDTLNVTLPVGNTTQANGLTFNFTVQTIQVSNPNALFESEIFGIDFSNIEVPSIEDTEGEKIVGYQIVRCDRDDNNKTVLDTGVLLPLLCKNNNEAAGYVSHGHLIPNVASTRIQNNIFALIHPEHKFNKKEYASISEVVEDGIFKVTRTDYIRDITQDVQPGTTYNSSAHKKGERDVDGFDLDVVTRHRTLEYLNSTANQWSVEEPDMIFLNTFFGFSVETEVSPTNSNIITKDIYNLSADNRMAFVKVPNTTQNKIDFKTDTANPEIKYVILKRNIASPYSNFRLLPYYKQHQNIQYFTDNNTSSIEVFSGDTYISPIKYHSSIHYNVRERSRANKKKTFLQKIGGAILAVAGVAISILSGGTLAPLGAVLISVGVSQIQAGFELEQMQKVLNDLYDQGLRATLKETDVNRYFGPNPADDSIQWFTEILSDLWFESSVNMNWRIGSNQSQTDYLNPVTAYTPQVFSQYGTDKLTNPDHENDGGKTYAGIAKAEIYEVNKDYERRDKEKTYFTLGLEYDCCSDCVEKFPNRVHYSEQSFQEELTDNYRVFLPNNYKDIEGQTGDIINMFRIKENLFIHTQEALWSLPKTVEERITNNIVSFIGTGSFLSLPPKIIIDESNGNSGGLLHKWSTVKTPFGVFFVSENQAKIYNFNGQTLTDITLKGMKRWFRNNIPLAKKLEYYSANKTMYPYDDMLSHSLGVGFICTYDSDKERILITKKDFIGSDLNNSWTISYNLNYGYWDSFHSYLPDFYFHTSNKFYSFIKDTKGSNAFWKHNKKGHYQNFYNERKPFIIEYVSINNKDSIQTKIWDHIEFITKAKKYDLVNKNFNYENYITFNKAMFYNTNQNTGLIDLKVKDTNADLENYLSQQIQNTSNNSIIIDKNEKNWSLNDIRNLREDYDKSMFNNSIENLQESYPIDKILNQNVINYNKEWFEMETMRDKYLVMRFIFDNFDDVKLLFNYSLENGTISNR